MELNQKFGKYHTLQELADLDSMRNKCEVIEEERLVEKVNQMLVDVHKEKND